MKQPGPDHPITISREGRRVRVRLGGRTIADTTRALTLKEASYPPVYYVPRADADMSLLTPTAHSTHCPYKGDASYFTISGGGRSADNAVELRSTLPGGRRDQGPSRLLSEQGGCD